MNEHQLLEAVAQAAERLLARLNRLTYPGQEITELRRRLDDLRAWQEQANEADRPVYVRTQTCKSCQALFFFARHGDDAEETEFSRRPRWIPLELDAIDAEGVIPEWRWVVDFKAYPPIARPIPEATSIYVDHRQTCGTGDGPRKHCLPYLRRYKVNQSKVNAEMENDSIRATNKLLAFQQRLADKERHDDS